MDRGVIIVAIRAEPAAAAVAVAVPILAGRERRRRWRSSAGGVCAPFEAAAVKPHGAPKT